MPFVADAEALARPHADLAAEAEARGPGPWRIALAGDPRIRAVLIGWPAGFRTVPHRHPRGTELFVVRSGVLGFRLAEAPELEVGPGGFFVARPHEVHGLHAVGPDPLVIMAIVSPNEDLPDETIDEPGAWPDWPAGPTR
jgi:quercetin dioxygenase-like cupin family protein